MIFIAFSESIFIPSNIKIISNIKIMEIAGRTYPVILLSMMLGLCMGQGKNPGLIPVILLKCEPVPKRR